MSRSEPARETPPGPRGAKTAVGLAANRRPPPQSRSEGRLLPGFPGDAPQATAHTLQYFTLSSALAPTVGGATYILFGWQGIACLGAGLKFLQLVVLVTDSTVQGQVVHICSLAAMASWHPNVGRLTYYLVSEGRSPATWWTGLQVLTHPHSEHWKAGLDSSTCQSITAFRSTI